MKKVLTGLCVASLILVGSTSAWSTTPSKKTNKNAVESSQEIKSAEPAVTLPPPASTWADKFETGWKKGLFFQSKDKKFSMKTRIRMQPRYEYTANDNKADDSTFRMRRLKFSWEGNAFSKNLSYKVQIVPTASKSEDFLEDAALTYKVADEFKFNFGQFKVPYNRQQITSSGRQQFPDRSLASDEFRFSTIDRATTTTCTFPGGGTVAGVGIACGSGATASTSDKDTARKFHYDLGAMFQGELFNKKLEYNLAFTNGSGLNRTNANKDLLYTGRLVWNVLGQYGYSESDVEGSEHPALMIGASGGYNVQDVTKTKILQAGGELGFKYKGASLQAEYFLRHNNPTGTAKSTKDHGYYAQAGYFVIPNHLEIAARASQYLKAGASNNKSEYTGAVNYYFFGHDLKLQGDYSYLPRQESSGNLADHRFRLQLQAWF